MSIEMITLIIIVVLALFGTLYVLSNKIDKAKEELLRSIKELTEQQTQDRDKPE